jgi:hypothetical protein
VFSAWDNTLISRRVLRVCKNLTSGLLLTKTPNKWRRVERSCNDTHKFGGFVHSPPVVIASALGTLPMLCKSSALSRAKTLVPRFVTRGTCRKNAWQGPSSYRKVKVWITRLERIKGNNCRVQNGSSKADCPYGRRGKTRRKRRQRRGGGEG